MKVIKQAMAPIKFEENIKDKLDKRTMQPPIEAWAKLSSRLDAQEKNASKSRFWWFGIAASIVALLCITSLVFKTPITLIKPAIVDVNTKSEIKTNGAVASEKSEVLNQENLIITQQKPAQELSAMPQKETAIHKSVTKMVTTKKQHKFNTVIATQVIKRVEQNIKEESVASLNLETVKKNAVVVQIENLNKGVVGVTDQEIDNLLQKAEIELFKYKLQDENIKTVTASNLLQEVETDLEQSFRTKVFEKLKNNYDSVKTAVANRNN